MIALTIMNSNIYLSWLAQIALLEVEEVFILSKYTDYTNIFSPNSMAKLSKHIGINNYSINLINDKQLFYGPIYSLGLVELETLKLYIEINLANCFIRLSKLLTNALILFICKKDNSLWLYINYQGLNNLTIKNRYLLPLISKFFECLSCVKYFI